ncbi:MAG TPA: VanZ family protein [Flavobacteriales bacterium]
MNNTTIAIAATFLWAAIVFCLHVIKVDLPKDEPLLQIPHADKLVHFSLFAVMSFLAGRCYTTISASKITFSAFVVVLICCAVYGALLEWIQAYLTTERSGDIWDWMADLAGIITGLIIARSPYLRFFFDLQRRESL